MKEIILALVLIGVLVSISTAQALSPSFDIILTSQEPFPAEPGENVDIEIEIQNSGDGTARDVVLEIIYKEPFKLLPGEEIKRSFPIIQPDGLVSTNYKIHIDEDAVTNEYDIEFRLILNDLVSIKKEVSVDVQGEPKVILEKIVVEPAQIEAGGHANVTVYAKNVGTGTARHLLLTLNSTPELIPALSSGSFYVGHLAPGVTGAAEMMLSVDSTAEEKTFVMMLTATYQDESNDDNQEVFDIGIPVTGTVQLDIIKTEPNYQRGLLEIEIANKGTADAKSVEARLFKNGDLVDIDYISQIKSTKKTTFNFPLIEEGKGTLEIIFTGPGLMSNKITKDIVFDYKAGNGSSDGGATAIVVIVIIIIVGFYFWRRRKKKKGMAGEKMGMLGLHARERKPARRTRKKRTRK